MDVAIFHFPDNGLSPVVLADLKANPPARMVYVNAELTMPARDGKQLVQLSCLAG
jgi:hypothetical protein